MRSRSCEAGASIPVRCEVRDRALHVSRPPVPQLDRHFGRMATFEAVRRKRAWLTEGRTSAAFRSSGTLGHGWLERYGIDAVEHEFNCN